MRILILTFSVFLAQIVFATEKPAQVPEEANIIEHLDTFVDTNLLFTDQNGNEKPLGEFFLGDKPIIIAPVYFECPRLCTLTQQGAVDVLNKLKLEMGKEFKVLSVSFNHKERTSQALDKFNAYSKLLDEHHQAKGGWDFLTGSQASVTKLMQQIGFSYKEDKGEFIHSAGFVILTPKGKISRYFYGIQFDPNALRFALVEAVAGRIGNSYDKILLYCFRFDPTKGKYSLAIWNVTRIICTAFAIVFFLSLIILKYSEGKKIKNIKKE